MTHTPARAAAELAGDWRAVLEAAERLAAAAPGPHGRRREGRGEAFWQFREHRPEDGARNIDWRKSARSDRLYVREQEREAAETFLFWVDASSSFVWSSSQTLPKKRDRGLILALALASLLARGGERIGALGAQPHQGGRAMESMAMDFARGAMDWRPPPPHTRLVIVSDFYEPADAWAERLSALAARDISGVMLRISDPAEEDFPFAGRRLFAPPQGGIEALIADAAAAKAPFQARLDAHRAELAALGARLGFRLLAHRTDAAPAPALAALSAGLGLRLT